MELPRVVVFGEALTDFVRVDESAWQAVSGGACWNVARVVATLGLPAAWAGAISNDLLGQDIAGKSRAAGLDMRFQQVVSKPPLIAMVHQKNPPQYFFIGTDSADLAFDETLLPSDWEQHCELAHFGCISLVRQPLGTRLVRIAERLKARNCKISFDPNYRNLMGPDYPILFEHMLALADIVKISDEDMAAIYPDKSGDSALAHIRAIAPHATLLYTRGAQGLTLLHDGDELHQDAFHVAVSDTVGAGDACLGSFIASQFLMPDAGKAAHLQFSAATAAVVCSHAGAYAPGMLEVNQFMDSIGSA